MTKTAFHRARRERKKIGKSKAKAERENGNGIKKWPAVNFKSEFGQFEKYPLELSKSHARGRYKNCKFHLYKFCKSQENWTVEATFVQSLE